MSRERLRELRFSRWARRRASLDGGVADENNNSKRLQARAKRRRQVLPRPPAPVLALSATSLVVRWLAEQPQMYGVATVDYELQCRVKNSTGVAPKWYSPSTSAPPTHPTMKLALRSAARTATLSGLTTYCDPLAFRVRMIHRSQDSDEASGAKKFVAKVGLE